MIKKIFLLIAAALFLNQSQLHANQLPEQLIAKTIDNKAFDLIQLQGRVVIVDFWASWCSVCQAEMPILESIYKNYHQKGLEIIGISVDDKHSFDDAKKVGQKLNYSIAMLGDVTVNSFGDVKLLPTIYVVDKKGVIQNKLIYPEQMSEESINKIIKSLL